MPDAWTQQLDTYLDGELSAGEMSALDAHVRACSDCAAEVLGRLQLKRAVQTAGKRFAPSADFRQRIQKMSAAKRQQRHWSWQMAAIAAVFLVVLGISLVRVKQENYTRQIYTRRFGTGPTHYVRNADLDAEQPSLFCDRRCSGGRHRQVGGYVQKGRGQAVVTSCRDIGLRCQMCRGSRKRLGIPPAACVPASRKVQGTALLTRGDTHTVLLLLR